MIKSYSYRKDKNKYCSKHTQVKELASKSGSKLFSDEVKVDTELLEMVEKLFTKLQCKKYIISSGYRTPAHDKAVGGSGRGQHTLGKAIDACFYWKDGTVIPAQIVCCVAQDLGFRGIANINSNYIYIHLDMRASGRYYGDETKGTNTVTNDFYQYFGVSKSAVGKYTGEAQKKSVEAVAREVIAGKWGNGTNRKKALTTAGYNYKEVQAMVNKLLR